MKTQKILLYAALPFVALFFQSCQKEVTTSTRGVVLPTRFKVEIPTSLTNTTQAKSAFVMKNGSPETLSGNGIYMNLNTFIAVGKGAGDIIQNIIGAIVIYKIETLKTVTYTGGDDQRIKNMVVKENVTYNGRVWK